MERINYCNLWFYIWFIGVDVKIKRSKMKPCCKKEVLKVLRRLSKKTEQTIEESNKIHKEILGVL